MHKSKSIFVFFLTIIILISSIITFNYVTDPYNIRAKELDIYINPIDMIYTLIKSSKNIKNETVIMGDSGTSMLMGSMDKRYFNKLFQTNISWANCYEILKNYLDIHNETKNVIIFVNYGAIVYERFNTLPKYTGKNYTIEEFVKLFLSADATKKSILKIKNKDFKEVINENAEIEEDEIIETETDENAEIEEDENLDIICFSYHTDIDFILNKNLLNEKKIQNYSYIKKIIELLEEKNINILFVFPPNNAVYLAEIYKNKNCQEAIEDFKRNLVSEAAKVQKVNINIYDMAFVNKYTKEDVTLGSPYYYNFNHPNRLLGSEVMKILYDKRNEDKSIYYRLNSENINSIIDIENEMLQDYINENQDIINRFEQYSKFPNKYDSEHFIGYRMKDLTKKQRKQLNYLDKLSKRHFKLRIEE